MWDNMASRMDDWMSAPEHEAQPFEKHPDLAAHILRMAHTGQTGSGEEWNDFLAALNRALTE